MMVSIKRSRHFCIPRWRKLCCDSGVLTTPAACSLSLAAAGVRLHFRGWLNQKIMGGGEKAVNIEFKAAVTNTKKVSMYLVVIRSI